MDEPGEVDVSEFNAFLLLRQGALGVEDRKRVLTLMSGNMKTDKIEQAMRTLATSVLCLEVSLEKRFTPPTMLSKNLNKKHTWPQHIMWRTKMMISTRRSWRPW